MGGGLSKAKSETGPGRVAGAGGLPGASKDVTPLDDNYFVEAERELSRGDSVSRMRREKGFKPASEDFGRLYPVTSSTPSRGDSRGASRSPSIEQHSLRSRDRGRTQSTGAGRLPSRPGTSESTKRSRLSSGIQAFFRATSSGHRSVSYSDHPDTPREELPELFDDGGVLSLAELEELERLQVEDGASSGDEDGRGGRISAQRHSEHLAFADESNKLRWGAHRADGGKPRRSSETAVITSGMTVPRTGSENAQDLVKAGSGDGAERSSDSRYSLPGKIEDSAADRSGSKSTKFPGETNGPPCCGSPSVRAVRPDWVTVYPGVEESAESTESDEEEVGSKGMEFLRKSFALHKKAEEKAGKGAGSLWGRVRSAVEVNELQVRKAVVNTSGMQGRPKTKVMRHVERLYGIELWDKSSRRDSFAEWISEIATREKALKISAVKEARQKLIKKLEL